MAMNATFLLLLLLFLLNLAPRLVSPRLDRGGPTMRTLFMAEELVTDFGLTVDVNSKLGRGTTALFPAVNFSCTGTISAWTAAGNRRNRNDSLQLGTCAQSCPDESNVSFGVSSGGEQLSCVGKKCAYRFTLSESLRFVEGDIIVIKQLQQSMLEVFYSEERQRRRRMRLQPSSPKRISGVPFITLDTDADECVHGTLMKDAVTSFPTLSYERQQMIFPSLSFPLHGNITEVTVAGSRGKKKNRHHPELQVWRSEQTGGYRLISRGQLQPTGGDGGDSVFHVSFSPPLQVSEEDVLGIFLPPTKDSSLEVAFVRDQNRTSYAWNTGKNTAPPHTELNTSTNAGQMQAVPIISVRVEGALSPPVEELERPVSASPAASSHVVALTTVSMAAPTTSTITTLVSSATPLAMPPTTTTASSPTLSPLSSPSLAVTPLPPATTTPPSSPAATVTPLSPSTMPSSLSATVVMSSSSQSPSRPPLIPTKPSRSTAIGDVALVVAVSATSVAVAVVITVTVAIAAVLLCRRRRRRRKSHDGRTTTPEHHLDNLLYSDDNFSTLKSHTPQYAVIDHMIPPPALYDRVAPDDIDNQQPPHLPDHAPHEVQEGRYIESEKEGNGFVRREEGVREKEAPPEVPLWGQCVPTQEQRDNAIDHPYAVLEQPSTLERNQDFFDETPTYWVPASNRTELYAQLAFRRYREIPRQQIQIISHLGSGQFGTVNRAVWNRPSEEGVKEVEVAVKMLQPRATEENSVKFLREAAINGQFRHPYVVQLFGVVTVDKPLMMVLELLTNGDLRSYLIERRPPAGRLPSPDMPRQLCQFCLHVAMGMEYLGRKSFIHRDLAARNVLVTDNHVCKIADFGLSRELDAEAYYIARGGEIPVKWTAPEALHYKKFSTASDVWSYGCLMYEIWSLGHRPFEGYSNAETLKVVDEGCRLTPPPGTPREVYKLMMDCWHPDRSCRPSFSDITETLSQPDHTLLVVASGNHSLHPLATTLGSPLEAGSDLHSDLQNLYLQH